LRYNLSPPVLALRRERAVNPRHAVATARDFVTFRRLLVYPTPLALSRKVTFFRESASTRLLLAEVRLRHQFLLLVDSFPTVLRVRFRRFSLLCFLLLRHKSAFFPGRLTIKRPNRVSIGILPLRFSWFFVNRTLSAPKN